jgi:hypothetical protein
MVSHVTAFHKGFEMTPSNWVNLLWVGRSWRFPGISSGSCHKILSSSLPTFQVNSIERLSFEPCPMFEVLQGA